jgi:hypothetical protein
MSPIFKAAAEQWRAMRTEFDLVLEAAYRRAEEGAHGSMLNATGRRGGVSAYSLLTGPWSRVEKYGSPELIEHFQKHGRPSLADFEREWMMSRLGRAA